MLANRHRDLPKPRGIVAISPALELNGDLRPPTSNDPMLPKWLVNSFHKHYGMTREELTASSIYYENDISFLPDTFVIVRFPNQGFTVCSLEIFSDRLISQVSDTEQLFDETIRFAKKFARLPIKLKIYPQWPHAGTMWFVLSHSVPYSIVAFYDDTHLCWFSFIYPQLQVHAREHACFWRHSGLDIGANEKRSEPSLINQNHPLIVSVEASRVMRREVRLVDALRRSLWDVRSSNILLEFSWSRQLFTKAARRTLAVCSTRLGRVSDLGFLRCSSSRFFNSSCYFSGRRRIYHCNFYRLLLYRRRIYRCSQQWTLFDSVLDYLSSFNCEQIKLHDYRRCSDTVFVKKMYFSILQRPILWVPFFFSPTTWSCHPMMPWWLC